MAATETRWLAFEVATDVSPTGFPVEFAFAAPGTDPTGWVPGGWETDPGPPVRWRARVLVGPAGVTNPGPGRWRIWLRITAAPEVVVMAVETLEVRAADPLVLPSEVATWVGRPLGVDDDDWLAEVIARLTAELEAWLGRPVTVRSFEEVHVLAPGQSLVHVGATPVVEVTEVAIVPTAGPVVVLSAGDYAVHPWGIEMAPAPGPAPFAWADPPAPVAGPRLRIRYRGGIDGHSEEAIRAAITRAAGREWLMRLNDAQGLASMSVEGTSYQPIEGAGLGGFVQAELDRLRRFKRRRHVG